MALTIKNACKCIPGGSPTSVSKQQTKHTQFPPTEQAIADNSTEAQRQRLLEHLMRHGSLDTVQARRDLDIMHPGGRVLELRKAGVVIQTIRVSVPSEAGKLHSVGRYVLAHKNEKVDHE